MRIALLSLMVLSSVVSAQEADPARAAAERRADQLVRGLRTLELSEEQQAKIRELAIEGELAAEKMRQERTTQVEQHLDDAQKAKYRELLAQREARRGAEGGRPGAEGGRPGAEGGRPGAEGGQGRGQMLRRYGLTLEQLSETLGLSDAQKEQVGAVLAEWGRGLREVLQNADRSQVREAMTAQLAKVRENISALLDESQKAKFAEANQHVDARLAEGGRPGPGGAGEGEGEGPRNADPEALIARRTQEAVTALALEVEEAAVLTPLVEKLVRHNVTTARELRTQRDEIAKLAGTAGADLAAVDGLITRYGVAQQQAVVLREKLQQGLRELLTTVQEYRLIGMGLLAPPAPALTTESAPAEAPAEK